MNGRRRAAIAALCVTSWTACASDDEAGPPTTVTGSDAAGPATIPGSSTLGPSMTGSSTAGSPPVATAATSTSTSTSSSPTTSTGAVAPTTAGPTTIAGASGLDALLVQSAELPTPTSTGRPQPWAPSFCGVGYARMPLDARQVLLYDGVGTTVTHAVELHPNVAAAATAFGEYADIISSCQWATQLPDLGRQTDLAVQFVASPELVAAVPGCQTALSGGVVLTTTDEGPPDRRDILLVIALCDELVTTIRVDLDKQPPIDQQPWIAPLVNALLTRVGAAVST